MIGIGIAMMIKDIKKPKIRMKWQFPVWYLSLFNLIIFIFGLPIVCIVTWLEMIPFQIIILIYPVSVLIMSVCMKSHLKIARSNDRLYIKFYYWVYLPFLVGISTLCAMDILV